MIICKHKKACGLFLGFFILSLLVPPFSNDIYAEIQDVIDTKEEKHIVVYQGDLVTLKVYSLTRIAITTPGIVRIVSADVDELLLVGNKVGETPMYIWDEYGKRNLTIRVFKQDLDMIIERIEALFEAAQIEGVILSVNNYEGKIVATGKVPKEKKKEFKDILKDFKATIIDFTNEEGELIHIDVQVSELTTTLTKTLGFDWNTGASGLIFGYEEADLLSLDGSIGDWFRIMDVNRTTKLLVTVSALIQEGKGRVLSKPSVVVTDGESVSFSVGGEIPITTTTQSSGGNITENIIFKTYGVQMTIKPEIKGEKIDLDINVDVRDIDSANAVGDNVAYTTTTARTKVSLDNEQTIVLAGFIKHNTSETIKRVPILGSIPVFGALFRHKNTPLTDKELVISMTPTILSRIKQSEEASVKEDDFFWAEEGLSLEGIDKGFKGPEKTLEAIAREEQEISFEEKLDEILEKEGETSFFDMPEEIILEESAEVEEASVAGEAAAVEESAAVAAEIEPSVVSEEESPLPTEGTSFDESNRSDAITVYVQSIQRKISRAISFPYEAKKQGWAGTVKLSLLVLSDGSLSDVTVRESSGHGVLDKDAINTTQILAPFEPFPPEVELEEIWVTIPIIYTQEDN